MFALTEKCARTALTGINNAILCIHAAYKLKFTLKPKSYMK